MESLKSYRANSYNTGKNGREANQGVKLSPYMFAGKGFMAGGEGVKLQAEKRETRQLAECFHLDV